MSPDLILEASVPKRVKTLTPRCGNTIPPPVLGCNVRHPVPRTRVLKPPQNPGRIKILRPGCEKTISQILLGSSVRVRNRKSFSPDLASLQVNCESVRENTNVVYSSPIEVVSDEKSSEKNSFAEELLLSASDDESYSGSSSNSVHECPDSDVTIVLDDTESEESKNQAIEIESDTRLKNSDSLLLSVKLEEEEFRKATKTKKRVKIRNFST